MSKSLSQTRPKRRPSYYMVFLPARLFLRIMSGSGGCYAGGRTRIPDVAGVGGGLPSFLDEGIQSGVLQSELETRSDSDAECLVN